MAWAEEKQQERIKQLERENKLLRTALEEIAKYSSLRSGDQVSNIKRIAKTTLSVGF